MDLLNRPFVFRVGNHKRPATQSLVDCGLDAAKAMAWDWPGQRRAGDYTPKELPPPFELVYAGSISQPKGVGDLIDAAAILHRGGLDFRLSVIGSGQDLLAMQEKARSLLPDGIVRFAGRLPNDEVFHSMRGATLVFVPSRHEFAEGMPLTLTEGLASRTPVVASDHSVIIRGFRDGEGLRLFRASDPSSLADTARAILHDPDGYRRLSETTADALDRVNCPYSFGDLIALWEEASSKPTGRPWS